MNLAPIILFCYNRPNHLKQTLEALAKNDLADQSVLYIFCDGAKQDSTTEQQEKIAKTRAVAKSKNWCKEIHIIEQDKNKGLANSIINGVSEIINQYGKIIVLEDDIVTETGFLKYMNEALNFYENKKRVFHISGFNNETPYQNILPKYYFLHFMSCWGWATWSDRWNQLDKNFKNHLNNVLNSTEYYNKFNYDGVIKFHEQLEANINNKIKTWAILWYSTIMNNNGLCLTPKYSFIQNIGMDGTGENCGTNTQYKKIYSKVSVKSNKKFPLNFNESQLGRTHLKLFYKYGQAKINIFTVIRNKLKNLKYKMFSKLYHLKTQYIFENIKINKVWAGNNYGGFYLHADVLSSKSIIMSFGIGEDVSFDEYIIKNFNAPVYGFDPTPKSINWVKENFRNPNFIFSDYGISSKNEVVQFYLPKNDEYVSGSTTIHEGTSENKAINVNLKSLSSIIKDLNIKNIDVLKMDIEGSEYDVLENILDSKIYPKQLLIEFHDRFYPQEKNKSHNILKKLYKKGYRIFGISNSKEEISLILKTTLK